MTKLYIRFLPTWIAKGGKLILSVAFMFLSLMHSSAQSCDCDCEYRKEITLTYIGSADLTDYQVRVDLDYESAMSTDYSNLRFITSNGITIPHWVEVYDVTHAIVWMRVPNISAPSTTVYVFYGGTSCVEDTWIASDVFLYYDDMETFTGWNSIGTNSISSSTFDGESVLIKQTNCDPDGGWKLIGNSINNFRLITREQRNTSTSNGGCSLNRYGVENGSSNGYGINRTATGASNSSFGFERRTAGSASNSNTNNFNHPIDNWYRTELTHAESGDNSASIYDDLGNIIGSVAGSISPNYTGFNRIVVRGGHDYYIDFMAIGQYDSNDPVVTVGSEEKAPPTIEDVIINSGFDVMLKASGALLNDIYIWYDAASGGNVLKTSTDNLDNTYTTEVLTVSTDYWVSTKDAGGNESDRVQVTVKVEYPCDAAASGSLDTDGDNVSDICDLDDDNDGVLDSDENGSLLVIDADPSSADYLYSTIYDSNHNLPQLNSTRSWCATSSTSNNEFVGMLFNQPSQIVEVTTQGRADYNQWVTAYELQGTKDGTTWVSIDNYTGNSDRNSLVTHSVINTDTDWLGARIRPTARISHNSLRFEFKIIFFDNNLDNDGDGVPNHLDLDSDGDGCSDAFEAGATTDKTADFKFTFVSPTNDVNNNGLADVIENGITGEINYTSTYTDYALANNVVACIDTDNDGIDDLVDIDDDNDGILDSDEDFNIAGLSTELWLDASDASTITSNSNNDVSQWNDKSGNNNHVSQANVANQPKKGVSSISFVGSNDNMITNSAIKISDVDIYYVRRQPLASSIDFNGGGYAICCKNGQNSVINRSFGSPTYYVNGTSETPANRDQMYDLINTNKKMMLSVVGANLSSWSSFGLSTYGGEWRFDGDFYEIVLVDGSKVDDAMRQKIEGYLAHKWGIEADLPVSHPYKTNAPTSDLDNDGIINSLDLDSDGDACSDALEAGATTDKTTDFKFAFVSPTNDVNNNGLADNIENGTTGEVNYISTYKDYALTNTLNACVDTDSDGIGDLVDIDDDNDGILDVVEDNCDTKISELNWHGTAAANITTSGTNIQVTGSAWANAYSDETFSLPISMSGRVTAAVNGMIGFIPQSASETTSWNDGGYKFQFNAGNGMYVRHGSVTRGWLAPSIIGTEFLLEIDADGNMNYWHNGSIVYSGTVPLTKYKITLSRGSFSMSNLRLYNPLCKSDVDGDGVVNSLDLDSDGDGCSDAFEAGATTNNITDYKFTFVSPTNDVNNNGLADNIENGTAGEVNYTSTYFQAISNYFNACVDSDGDGIGDLADIDDDNDGVLDAIESPSCFYTEAEVYEITSITTDIAPYSINNLERAIDRNASTYAAFANNAGVIGDAIFTVTPTMPAPISSIEYDATNWALSNGADRFKLQGYNGANWLNLSADIAITASSGLQTISNTVDVVTAFEKYRILITVGSNYYGGIREIRLNASSSFVASKYTKPNCDNDIDGDGVNNHLDLDSDGDGCSDALESGATTDKTTNFKFTFVSPTNDVNNNGLADNIENGITGEVNYTNTYTAYALSDELNACIDTDNDGISDLVDIDDDNDGILDLEEGCQPIEYDFTELTWTADAAMSVSSTDASTLVGASTSGWKSALSNETFSLPLDMSFTYSVTSGATMFGFANEYSALNNNWTVANSYGFYINRTISYTKVVNSLVNNVSPTTGQIHRIVIDASGNLTLYRDGVLILTQTGLSTTDNYKFYISSNGSSNKPYENISFRAVGSPVLCVLDTDGDGIPNGKDLDSDGDGCSDALEAGVTTDKTADFKFTFVSPTNDVNNNGLVDNIENGTTGEVNYISTYTDYALSDKLNACIDTDKDGVGDLVDVDDDNDGVLDSVEDFNITGLSPELWLDASDASTITSNSNNDVSQWDDKSGNNNHVSQANVANQPKKGISSISFVGSNDNMRANSAIKTSDIDIYYVRKQPLASSIDFNGGGYATCCKNGQNSVINRSFGSPSYYVNGSSETPANRDQMYDLINTNKKMMLSVVGANMSTWSSFGLSTYSGEWRFDGDFYEIVLVDGSTVDDAMRQKIEGYLAHKWGLEADLPISHPYKTKAPLSDIDGDGIINSLDLDSDNDGIPDNIEAQSTTGYIVPVADNTAAYESNNGLNSAYVAANGNTPIDTDADGIPDFLDTDSDNAQTDDTTEAGIILANSDNDNDGLDDAIDTDDNNFGPVNSGITDVMAAYTNNGVDVDWRIECPNGTILTGPNYVLSATGASNWGASNNLRGEPNGTIAGIYQFGYIQVLDFGEIISIGSELIFYVQRFNGYANNFTVEYSTDNSTFVSHTTPIVVTSTTIASKTITATENFRYIRLKGASSNTHLKFDAVEVSCSKCRMFQSYAYEDSGAGASSGGVYGDGIENGSESSLNLPAGLFANVVQGGTVIHSGEFDATGYYHIPNLDDGTYDIVMTTDPLGITGALPNLYSFSSGDGSYSITVLNDVVSSPSTIPTFGIKGCEFGEIISDQYATTSLGGYNIGATAASPNVEGAPDGLVRALYGDGGSPITLQYETSFSAGSVVTITARYIDSRQGYIYLEASTDGVSYVTASPNITGFEPNSGNYTDISFTIPASLTDDYKYLKIKGQTGNRVYIRIDAVHVQEAYCTPRPTVTDDTPTTNEDTPVVIDVLDNDSNVPIAGIFTTTQPTNGAVVIDSNGTPNDPSDDVVSYTPNADYNGADSFEYTICDASNNCDTGVVNVTVVAVNDMPSFSVGSDVNVDANSGAYSNTWATVISKGPANENTQNLTFTVSNDNNSLFSVQPSINAAGNLTFTAASSQFGEAIVSVYLKDDGGTVNGGVDQSATVDFKIIVTDNVAPILIDFPADFSQSYCTDSDNQLKVFAAGSLTLPVSHYSDNCVGPLTIEYRIDAPVDTYDVAFGADLDGDPSDKSFPVGVSIVYFRVKDAASPQNISEIKSFTVTVSPKPRPIGIFFE